MKVYKTFGNSFIYRNINNAGEMYAQNNGLENKLGKAQQIGEIFGNKISDGLEDSLAKNKLAVDDFDSSDIVIKGTAANITGIALKCKGNKCPNSTTYYTYPKEIPFNIVIEPHMSEKEIYEKTLLLIAAGEKKGYKDATKFLKLWLEGNTNTYGLSNDIFEHPKVTRAIEDTYEYFNGG